MTVVSHDYCAGLRIQEKEAGPSQRGDYHFENRRHTSGRRQMIISIWIILGELSIIGWFENLQVGIDICIGSNNHSQVEWDIQLTVLLG